MVAIDTDVLALAYAFHRDTRQAPNADFLAAVRRQSPMVTIYSIMELLGQLSFNLSSDRLAQWPFWLQDRHGLGVIFPETTGRTAEYFFQEEFVDRPLSRMRRFGVPFLDGIILELVERTSGVSTFVTWSARHHRGKTHLEVLTPVEYLNR